jgi:glycosyltransferase involved in cell wall biosynthesis
MEADLSRVSLIVTTLNEEDNIGRCLESARGAGEIILVDSMSTDGTVGIAEKHGARVFTREFVSNADQKNWAIGKAGLDWILILDADEYLSADLRDEIARRTADPDADGYWLYRRNEFFGKKIRHCGWERDRVLRLFRRGLGRYPERAVHERLELDGRAGRLDEKLDHVPYRDLDDYIDRMKRYSLRGAEELNRRGRRWFPGMVIRPSMRFMRMYVLQLGFLDGSAGLTLCMLASVSVFFKYAWLREISRRGRGRPDERSS